LLLLRGEQKGYTKGSLSIVSMKKCGAEFVGTFALVFAGTGAIVINETSGGAITHVGISLTFGLIVLAMIYTGWRHFWRTLKSSGQFGFFCSPTLPVT
jgi:aquaporin Z